MTSGKGMLSTPIKWQSLLENEIRKVKKAEITQSVDANGVFVKLPAGYYSGVTGRIFLLRLE